MPPPDPQHGPPSPRKDTFERSEPLYAHGVPPRPARAGAPIQGQAQGQAQGPPGAGPAAPFLQVWFKCAGQYRRVYKNRDGSAYEAICPLCAKSCTFRVGASGTSRRMFEVSC
ncbi:MAG: hypothetical protein EA378_09965 [Phycisphaerales bacterium]|nr:MAG: hypothetical protein EA378_09965 [Phycisphaerales bacterium]